MPKATRLFITTLLNAALSLYSLAPYPFTAPAPTPVMMYFWKNK